MGTLKCILLAGALGLAAPAHAQSLDHWSAHIAEASARFGVPQESIRRVMRAESGGRTTLNGRPITSHAGAMGLMQLMPETWAEMRAAYGLGADPHDPRDNILAGTAYLRAMYERFGYPGMFGAYNAGPARYSRHLATGQRLPAETVAYVATIAGTRPARATHDRGSSEPVQEAPADPLFAARSAGRSPASDAASQPPGSDGLFVRLRTAPSPSR